MVADGAHENGRYGATFLATIFVDGHGGLGVRVIDFVAVLVEIRRDVAAHGFAHTAHVGINAPDMAVVQVGGRVVGHPVQALAPGTVKGEAGDEPGEVCTRTSLTGKPILRSPAVHEPRLTLAALVTLVFVHRHGNQDFSIVGLCIMRFEMRGRLS